MKTIIAKLFILTIAIVFSSSCGNMPSTPDEMFSEGPPPAIIPLPKLVEWEDNMYSVPEKNIICFNEGSEKAAAWLQELLKNANKEAGMVQGGECGNWKIVLDTGLEGQLGEEGYVLDITKEGVHIQGATEAGLFYGVQSLRQVFPAEIEQGQLEKEEVFLRQVHIEDQPEFEWRGTMVDVARSFFGLEYLKKHVDRMALYKLNRLHLHLTDDQGWRIEIKGWPKLTEVGSKGAVNNGNSGFLTQEEYMELQEYALARNVVIVPEIDMPGHIYAALVSYPELNCSELSNLSPKKATPPELYTGINVGWSKFCLENPAIYDFVSDVIEELSSITTGPYIHIGGDEIEDPLYEEFVVKADAIVQEHDKTSIGWEEVTQAEVSPDLISQQWRDRVESVVDVKVIQSLCSNFYLDHANVPGQENTNNWCKDKGVSLEDIYSFRNDNQNVIGVEAPVWTEFVWSEEMLDDRFWPRTIAVAEVGWSSEASRNFEYFLNRLGRHGDRLKGMGVHFFDSPNVDWGHSKLVGRPGSVFSGFMPEP